MKIRFFLLLSLLCVLLPYNETFSLPTKQEKTAPEYTSQYYQDWFIDQIVFRELREGIFIDVGAHDGKSLSNTYFFEKYRGWKGLCVEPLPGIFKQLKTQRSCHLINACIGTKKQDEEFFEVSGYPEMLSGFVRTMDDRHIQRIRYECSAYGGSYRIITVPATPLATLLDQFNLHTIHFMSIDVEGAELEVLKSIDWNTTDIAVISIENNYDNNDQKIFLEKQGYIKVKQMRCDELYIKPTSSLITYINPIVFDSNAMEKIQFPIPLHTK